MIRNDTELKKALEDHEILLVEWGITPIASGFEKLAIAILEKRIEQVRDHWQRVWEYTERKKKSRENFRVVRVGESLTDC